MQIITNFLLVFALIRDTWKGHNLYKIRIFLNGVHLHPLVILTASVSFEKLWKSAGHGCVSISSPGAQRWHNPCTGLPSVPPDKHLSSQIHPENIPIVCVFYSFFKINSLTFEGLPQTGNKATVGILRVLQWSWEVFGLSRKYLKKVRLETSVGIQLCTYSEGPELTSSHFCSPT